MAVNRVADMTIEELRNMISEIVQEKTGTLEHGLQVIQPPRDSRTLQEVMESIERHRIVPPKGAKSNLELLREDRDR